MNRRIAIFLLVHGGLCGLETGSSCCSSSSSSSSYRSSLSSCPLLLAPLATTESPPHSPVILQEHRMPPENIGEQKIGAAVQKISLQHLFHNHFMQQTPTISHEIYDLFMHNKGQIIGAFALGIVPPSLQAYYRNNSRWYKFAQVASGALALWTLCRVVPPVIRALFDRQFYCNMSAVNEYMAATVQELLQSRDDVVSDTIQVFRQSLLHFENQVGKLSGQVQQGTTFGSATELIEQFQRELQGQRAQIERLAQTYQGRLSAHSHRLEEQEYVNEALIRRNDELMRRTELFGKRYTEMQATMSQLGKDEAAFIKEAYDLVSTFKNCITAQSPYTSPAPSLRSFSSLPVSSPSTRRKHAMELLAQNAKTFYSKDNRIKKQQHYFDSSSGDSSPEAGTTPNISPKNKDNQEK